MLTCYRVTLLLKFSLDQAISHIPSYRDRIYISSTQTYKSSKDEFVQRNGYRRTAFKLNSLYPLIQNISPSSSVANLPFFLRLLYVTLIKYNSILDINQHSDFVFMTLNVELGKNTKYFMKIHKC